MQDRLRSRFFHIPSGKYIHSQSLVYNYGCYDLVSTKQQPNGTYYSYILTSFNTSEIIEEQCTGLKDKNGKLIYEGDIVKCGNNGQFIYKVGFNKRFASFVLIRKEDAFNHYFGEAVDAEDVEVIGNIHENPDLLENKDE